MNSILLSTFSLVQTLEIDINFSRLSKFPNICISGWNYGRRVVEEVVSWRLGPTVVAVRGRGGEAARAKAVRAVGSVRRGYPDMKG